MRQFGRHRIIGAALGALPLVLSTGCSFDFGIGGPAAVDADQVAQRSSEMLTEQIGQAPDGFTCPEDLPAEVDAEIRCELTHGGESLGVTVTTTSVDGDDVQWDVQVDEAPAGDTAAEEDGAAQDDAEETAATDNATAVASEGQVSAAEVVEQSTAALQAAGRSPQNFACTASHLRAEVGAEMSCNFFEGSVLHNVTITTTAVDGGTVTWDIQVDEKSS
ncbi:DUF4333 domain-containing protein [Nocardiopsis quinghaiensis]|uniref:DUF4333 domain-containing protein n=1 Tax=Nocardiopsis quinghaiensis TaxID=464995 RepID=UPI00123BA577|nr:DUF4333 domain-containing protein [Nocardiopsis quinghaiensis]